MAIVDLSFPIRPHFRWKVAPERVATHANGDPLQSTVVTISCHAYTHVDAPLHFLPDGRDMAAMPVDQWMGEASVVDLCHLGANGEVTAEQLERHGAHVRRGDIVLLRTDWPRRTSVDTARFWHDGPFTGKTGCDWLVARGAKAVGYDYPPDHCIRETIAPPRRRPGREEYTTHAIFFPAGITVIEYLTNLDRIGAARCRFVALPLCSGRGGRIARAGHRHHGLAPVRNSRPAEQRVRGPAASPRAASGARIGVGWSRRRLVADGHGRAAIPLPAETHRRTAQHLPAVQGDELGRSARATRSRPVGRASSERPRGARP